MSRRRDSLWPPVIAGGLLAGALDILYAFLIACSMAVTYCLAARRWPLLVRRPVPLGMAYGLLLYAVMNYVVIPLSAAGSGSRDPTWIALTVVAHAVRVGLPIAWFASRAITR